MGLDSLAEKVETRTEHPDHQFLVGLLNEEIVKQGKKRSEDRTPSHYYSPSGLGKCKRSLYYKRLKAPVNPNPNVSRENIDKQDHGTDRHQRLQHYLSSIDHEDYQPLSVKDLNRDYLDIVSEEEYETLVVDTRYNLRFKVDWIANIRGTTYIIEIKTNNYFAHKDRTEESPYHTLQSVCYSLSLGINKVIYLYELSGGDFNKKSFLKIVTQEDRDKVLNKINQVEEYLSKNELPPKDTSNCKFCNYKHLCKQDQNVGG